MQNNKISSFQFLVLVIFFTIGSSILYVPSILSIKVQQDAWIATIIATIVGLLVIWLYITISMWFPKLTYIQVNEKIFGKVLGKTFSIMFVLMLFLYSSSLIAHSGTFLITQIFPKTPAAPLNIMMTIIIVMGVRLGLETIARSAEILIFVFFILFLILSVALIPQVNYLNLEPFLQSKPTSILGASFVLVIVSTVNSITLLVIFPAFLKEIKKAKKNFIIGNIIGSIIIIIITTLCIFVLGSPTTSRQVYPSYALAKVINVGDFLTRIESLMATLWILCIFFKSILYFYAATFGLSQILNIKDYRPLTYPLGIIMVVLSLLFYPDILDQYKFDAKIAVILSTIIGIFIPLLLVLIYMIRKKKLKKDPQHL
ncbi:endospore germination permease [Psychrobacillus sp. FJAT-51614]|uniref:Endospore germination permease n=1 Tax=Psychrobacillus mangrovi TaxID=3117745 RepID=A0ABU8F1M7_9BACI